jgi:hypothetical protein
MNNQQANSHCHSTESASSNLHRLKLALLAGTCLSGTSSAATVVESTDFGNTFATTTSLPAGTNEVMGTISNSPPSDLTDYFSFTNLISGAAFSISYAGGYHNFDVLDSAEVSFGGVSGTTATTISGTVPTNGMLIARVGYNEGAPSYTVNINSEAVPEPSGALLGGIGLTAGALLRRRRICVD